MFKNKLIHTNDVYLLFFIIIILFQLIKINEKKNLNYIQFYYLFNNEINTYVNVINKERLQSRTILMSPMYYDQLIFAYYLILYLY